MMPPSLSKEMPRLAMRTCNGCRSMPYSGCHVLQTWMSLRSVPLPLHGTSPIIRSQGRSTVGEPRRRKGASTLGTWRHCGTQLPKTGGVPAMWSDSDGQECRHALDRLHWRRRFPKVHARFLVGRVDLRLEWFRSRRCAQIQHM